MSKKKFDIKFDEESLLKLVNDAHNDLEDDLQQITDKLEVFDTLTSDPQSLSTQQFMEVMVRAFQAKGIVAERKIKIIQLVKDIHRNKINSGADKINIVNEVSPEEIQDLIEKSQNG